MDGKTKAQILRSVQNYNILPIISACNVKCIFCSHKQNPPGIEIYRVPFLSLNDIGEMIEFLNPAAKITIGESATRIIEGEPFMHPQIEDILRQVRERFPHTEIQITTNGNQLTKEKVQFLKMLMPIEINLSINSASIGKRQILMDDPCAEVAIHSPEWLEKYRIPFHGSIVAMPMQVGWEDLRQTIGWLDQFNAQTIRVFVPGFTRLAPVSLRFSEDLIYELHAFIEKSRQEIKTPLLLEPALIRDLVPQVEGIIKHSPAAKAGMARGDIIVSVNGQQPRSRVEAYHFLLKGTQTHVCFKRAESIYDITMKKKEGKSGGVVFAYDMAPSFWEDIKDVTQKYPDHPILLMASALGYPVVKKALSKLSLGNQFYSTAVESRFFGGFIGAAGLLVIQDFIDAYHRWVEAYSYKPQVVILPAVAFDDMGRDLLGKPYWQMQTQCSCTVEII